MRMSAYKTIGGYCIAVLLIAATVVHAAPTQPGASVWIVPANAKKGDTVELDALVYNSAAKTVTVSVLFATPTEDIATVNLTLPEGTAKTATSPWTVPNGQVTVTASVIKAVDANQKNVPELLGTIGTVTVGTQKSSVINVASFGVGAETWFGSLIGIIEPWRTAQATRYVALRDATKHELNVNNASDIAGQFNAPDAPGVPGGTQPNDAKTPSQRAFPIASYWTLLYASALAAIFASAALFYITIGLIILLLLRLFIRLFT